VGVAKGDELARQMVELLLHGIAARPAEPAPRATPEPPRTAPRRPRRPRP
jgi:hypothetical protein